MKKGKVKKDMIGDASERKITYKKRKETLMKKLEEITTLCGVEASLIIFSEMEEGGGVQTWPAEPGAVHGVVEKFKAVSEADIGKRKEVDMYSWDEARLEKEKLRLVKLRLGNEDREARQLMSECLAGKSVAGLSMGELSGVNYQIEESLRSLGSRMRDLMKAQNVKTGEKSVAGAEDNFLVPDPDTYLNLDFADYANYGMNMMGAGFGRNGVEDQAGPSWTKNQADRVGNRDGEAQ